MMYTADANWVQRQSRIKAPRSERVAMHKQISIRYITVPTKHYPIPIQKNVFRRSRLVPQSESESQVYRKKQLPSTSMSVFVAFKWHWNMVPSTRHRAKRSPEAWSSLPQTIAASTICLLRERSRVPWHSRAYRYRAGRSLPSPQTPKSQRWQIAAKRRRCTAKRSVDRSTIAKGAKETLPLTLREHNAKPTLDVEHLSPAKPKPIAVVSKSALDCATWRKNTSANLRVMENHANDPLRSVMTASEIEPRGASAWPSAKLPSFFVRHHRPQSPSSHNANLPAKQSAKLPNASPCHRQVNPTVIVSAKSPPPA